MTNTTNPKWEEQIIVVKRENLFDNERLSFQGVMQDKEVVDTIMNNVAENFEVMRRGSTDDPTDKSNNAEINKEYKQPIPYVVIKRGHGVFVYERLSQGGEGRLHNKLSLGVGGHMNPEGDITFDETLEINLNRELDEELSIYTSERKLEYIGLINNDEDEVGEVHLGILATLELHKYAIVGVKETDQLKGQWMTVEELKHPDNYERLEAWSKYVVDIMG